RGGSATPPRATAGRARQRPRRRAARGVAPGGRRRPQRDRPDARLRARLLHSLRDPARPRECLRRLPRAGILLGHGRTADVRQRERGARRRGAAVPRPHVHRSPLAVAPVPLVRELVALEEEFGTILVAACDRTSARFFEVTAYDVVELPSLTAEATRPGKFHGERQAKRGNMLAGGFGEHNYHMRIRVERQRHYAQVADRIFQIHTQRPLAGLVVAGIGVDAAALLPHLHTYLHDLVLGVVRLNPKRVTAAEVREAALSLREERERAWERAHAEAVREGVGTGWAVNGIESTLKALQRGQVRTLLADGHDDDRRIDDAIEEALAQRVQVDVVYDDRARRVVDGLAGLLRFRR